MKHRGLGAQASRSSSPAAVATDAVDPRRARRPRATPARGIRSRLTSSPFSLGFPLSLARCRPQKQTLNTPRRCPSFDPPLPELQAAIVESPPPGAAPRPPLRPRQAVQAGVQPFRRHHRFTATTSAGLRLRFRRRRASPCLTVTSIVSRVRLRSVLNPFPSF